MSAPVVPDEAIRAMAYGYAYERGVAYAREGAVRRVVWDEPSRTLTGLVAGSARQLYRATVTLHTAGGVRISSTRCSCPMDADCKHVVATLLRSNAGASAGVVTVSPADGILAAPPRPPAPPETTGWRSVLLGGAASAPAAPASKP